MTAHKDAWLGCDSDGCLAQIPDEAGGATDVRIDSLRSYARADGWRCTRRGDFCPDHASDAANRAAIESVYQDVIKGWL